MFLSDVFKMDPDFLENEEKYKTIKRGENETVSVQSDRLLQSDQSRVSSWQISWMKAAATPARMRTAATMTKRRMRTRRKQKVRRKCLFLEEDKKQNRRKVKKN